MDREAAIAKYKTYRSLDPFPEIEAALLNSADVHDYILAVGMVFPYEEAQLNGVTLSLRVGDVAVYWDEKDQKIRKDIKTDKEFRLKSNSIAFIQILEELRLPAYIIVRFNLRVTITYRGLLLGTGPIVDPGFDGKINIPIHNLTSNDYVFAHGEPLIEMEFTKISANSQWHQTVPDALFQPRNGKYKNWKPNFDKLATEKREIDYYLRRANQGNSIQSSLSPILNKAERSLERVEKVSEKVDTSLSRFNVGLLFSFAALLTAIIAIVNIFRGDIKELKELKIDQRMRTIEDAKLIENVRYLELQHQNDSVRIDSLFKMK